MIKLTKFASDYYFYTITYKDVCYLTYSEVDTQEKMEELGVTTEEFFAAINDMKDKKTNMAHFGVYRSFIFSEQTSTDPAKYSN